VVRVYLDRPWFSSGDGELLGVVLAPPSSYPPNEVLRPVVSHWGNDPIWTTTALAGGPQPATFPDAASVATGLVLDELTSAGASAPAGGFEVAGHAVQFDNGRGLWFSDIRIEFGSVYAPFVRLALARYQPSSLAGLELSRVVLTDFVQLFPDRTINLDPVAGNPNQFTVRVDGVKSTRNAWVGLVLDDDSIAISKGGMNTFPDLFRVSIEERIPGSDPTVGWKPRNDLQVPFQSTTTQDTTSQPPRPAGTPLWLGQVTLPSGRKPGQFRVVVREFEHLQDDSFTLATGTKLSESELPHFPHRVPVQFLWNPGAERVVFVETIVM
jgi:hypothetical protein